jgi:hypothetical protein
MLLGWNITSLRYYQTQEAPTIINKMNNTTINANPPPKPNPAPSAIDITS